MCQNIKIDIQEQVAVITIDEEVYTYQKLKLKLPKTKLEYALLKVVESAINN